MDYPDMQSDLEQFILKHKKLSGNKILKLYRKSGNHISNEKFYQIKRQINNQNKKKINYTNINVNINDYSQQKIKKEKIKKNKVKNNDKKKILNKEKKIKKEKIKKIKVKKIENKEKIKIEKPVYEKKLNKEKIENFNKELEKTNIENPVQQNDIEEKIILSDKQITENKIKDIILENPNLSKRKLFKLIKENNLHLRQSEILKLKREILNIPLDESKSHKKEPVIKEPKIDYTIIPNGDIYGHLEKWIIDKDLYEALHVINKGKLIKHSHTKFIMIGAYFYDTETKYIMYSIQNFNDLKYVLQQIINRRGMNTLIYKMLDCRKGFPDNKFMSGDLTVILK